MRSEARNYTVSSLQRLRALPFVRMALQNTIVAVQKVEWKWSHCQAEQRFGALSAICVWHEFIDHLRLNKVLLLCMKNTRSWSARMRFCRRAVCALAAKQYFVEPFISILLGKSL